MEDVLELDEDEEPDFVDDDELDELDELPELLDELPEELPEELEDEEDDEDESLELLLPEPPLEPPRPPPPRGLRSSSGRKSSIGASSVAEPARRFVTGATCGMIMSTASLHSLRQLRYPSLPTKLSAVILGKRRHSDGTKYYRDQTHPTKKGSRNAAGGLIIFLFPSACATAHLSRAYSFALHSHIASGTRVLVGAACG
jgi:hypothetical protein